MATGFRPVERDQEFLLPPNMSDWLPEGDVVWFVIDTVAALDKSEFYARAALRRDGQERRGRSGRAAYDPGMLLTLLVYAYACGDLSSRRIERLCTTDVAFRVICAGDVPDHTVLARFRQAHQEAFAGLFTQVLRLCREAGLARLCTVAIDGTKVAANASKQANRSPEWLAAEAERLRAERDSHGAAEPGAAEPGAGPCGGEDGLWEVVGQILADAAETDAAEDAVFGPARGDELPPGWDRRSADRLARIEAAAARLKAAEAARLAAQQAADAEQAARRAEADAAALAKAEAALAAELATRAARQQAWEQSWEHAAANPGAPVPRGRAPKPAEESVVVRRAQERVDTARNRVEHPDTAPRPGGSTPDPDRRRRPAPKPQANTTDPDSTLLPTRDGWVQGYNPQFAVTSDQVILALDISTSPADIVSFAPMVAATEHAAALLGDPDGIGTLLFDTGYNSNDTLTAPGPDRLIAQGKSHAQHTAARDQPTTGPPPEDATPREVMDHRLRTPEGAALYKRRGATVEPGIGNFKKLLDRFSRRGLAAVRSEAYLAATTFNILKIHRAAPT